MATKTETEIEAENLKRLFAGIRGMISRPEFAKKFCVPGGDAMIYQHINGLRPISLAAGLAYARGFGCPLETISKRLANEIAKGSELLSPNMSNAQSQLSPLSDTQSDVMSAHFTKTKTTGDIQINQFDAGGSMGSGVLLRDQPGVIQSWSVSAEWLNKNIKHHTGSKNLCIVTGFGDSMRPMFNPGDPLIVDRGVNSVEFDAIYFFRVGDEGFIKRLQRIPGEGLRAISENKAYESWTIKQEMDFEVFGRVLKVWKSEEY